MFVAMGTPPDALDDPGWSEAALTWFDAHLDDRLVAITLAEVDGEVVASAVGEVTALIPSPSCPNGSCGLLTTVSTLPGHRGRGHAAAVTDAVIGWFEGETDVTRIDLFATPEGARIYTRRGFAGSDFPAMRRTVERDRADGIRPGNAGGPAGLSRPAPVARVSGRLSRRPRRRA